MLGCILMKKIYLIAVILALLTGISVYNFAGAIETASKREYTNVVAAAINIPVRTILTKEMLVIKSIPIESASGNTIKDINLAVGLFSEGSIEGGETLSSTKLRMQGANTGSGMSYIIPEGKRAFTLPVDAISGVGGFLLPGDRIDILANMVFPNKVGGETVMAPTSLVILQNVEILASGTSVRVETSGVNVPYSTITIALTLQESVSLNMVSSSGILRMVLRSPLDKEIQEISPLTQEMISSSLK